eukprot:3865999-Lingulodinium_polyedra.AAC.1
MVSGYARPNQCGGIDSRGADIAQHCVRAIWAFAGAAGRSAALLFVDLTAAFASLMRELAITSDRSVEGIAHVAS